MVKSDRFSMAPSGGMLVLLLVTLQGALAAPPGMEVGVRPHFPNPPGDFKEVARRLMMKCIKMGYQAPAMMQNMSELPSRSGDVTRGDSRDWTAKENLLPAFTAILASVLDSSSSRNSVSRMPFLPESEQKNLTKGIWNCSDLPSMIRMMRNASKANTCYTRGFLAPLSWRMLTNRKLEESDMTPEDYSSMVWAAKPLLQDLPPPQIQLPPMMRLQHMEKMMQMLREVFGSLSENQRVQIREWVKERVKKNRPNCTMNPATPRPTPDDAARCPPHRMWLRKEVLELMGPYLSRLQLHDVDSASDDQLCQFYESPSFNTSFMRVAGMNPMLARRFLQRFQKCAKSKEEFSENMDRLGMLACYYYDAPAMNSTLSTRLISQLGHCDNSGVKKLRKHLVESLMSSMNSSQGSAGADRLLSLDTGVTMLSPGQLSKFSVSTLQKTVKKLGSRVRWRLSQARLLAMKLLEGKAVSGMELISLGPAITGVPFSMLKKVKAQDILGKEGLENVTEQMTKAQRKSLLEALRKKVAPPVLARQVPRSLLSSLSLHALNQANITSLDQVEGRDWNKAQSAFLVRNIIGKNIRPHQMRKLGSAIQGVTCRMIDSVTDSGSKEMAKAMTDTPHWLSRAQAVCAARRLFATLEKERAQYFRNITREELDEIPPLLLIYLPPGVVRDLPNSVCPTFLAKMTVANLSSLCSWSRPALTTRALRCLANGRNVSALSGEEVLGLGQLLCELAPAQLLLMNPGTLNSSLQAMASCPKIPQPHRLGLIRLLKQIHGNPCNWSAETMESLGPLLLLDDAEIRALCRKPWLKELLLDLKDSLPRASPSPPDFSAFQEKVFALSTQSGASRRKREDNGANTSVPTVELIEDLQGASVNWKAEELNGMSNETFRAAVETLGSVSGFDDDQLAVLSTKAVQAFGQVSGLKESEVIQLGCISRGFPDADLETLPISLEIMEHVAGCGWKQQQREAVWKGFVKRSGLTADKLSGADMTALSLLICGLGTEDAGKLQTDAFRDAVDALGEVECPMPVTKEFKKLAVAVFGVPSRWQEAEVATMGNIIAGLDKTELSSLDPSVFSFLRKTSIPLIPPTNFAALSASQLQALGPENVDMVTDAQRARLDPDKLNALNAALDGSRVEPPTTQPGATAPQQSGAPSLSIEGVAALVKPFLFLLVGFLLL